MKRKLIVGMTILSLTGAMLLGCTGNKTPNEENPPEQKNNEAAIMEEFDALVKNQDLAGMIEHLQEHIDSLTEEDATEMVLELENVQKEQLSALEERYFSDGTMQGKLMEVYEKNQWSLDLEKVEDEDLKTLLTDTINQGYKVETAEGTFFPIIDYGITAQFGDYLKQDIKDYLELMKTESDNVAVKDAAIIIEWSEVADRALKQQEFLALHGESDRAKEISLLFDQYVNLLVYGANNTPAFSYDNKKLEPELEEIYQNLADGEEGTLKTLFVDYLKVLERNQFTINDEISAYRDQMIDSLND